MILCSYQAPYYADISQKNRCLPSDEFVIADFGWLLFILTFGPAPVLPSMIFRGVLCCFVLFLLYGKKLYLPGYKLGNEYKSSLLPVFLVCLFSVASFPSQNDLPIMSPSNVPSKKDENVVIINGHSFTRLPIDAPAAAALPAANKRSHNQASRRQKTVEDPKKKAKMPEDTKVAKNEDDGGYPDPQPFEEIIVAERAPPGMYWVFVRDYSLFTSFENMKFCPNPKKTCIGKPDDHECRCSVGIVNSLHLNLGSHEGGFIVCVVHGANDSRSPHAAIIGPLEKMAEDDYKKVDTYMKASGLDKCAIMYGWFGRTTLTFSDARQSPSTK